MLFGRIKANLRAQLGKSLKVHVYSRLSQQLLHPGLLLVYIPMLSTLSFISHSMVMMELSKFGGDKP